MAAKEEVCISATRNDDSKQHEQESYQPTVTSMMPQENEDSKGQSESQTQLSEQIEGSTTEDGSVDKTISTNQQLQNRDGNNSQNNVDCEPQFPVKGEKALESQMMDEAKTKQTEKTMFNDKNIHETLCSQTTEISEVTGLDKTTEISEVTGLDTVHHEDQESNKVVNSEADTPIHVGDNSREKEPQFPVKGEEFRESQMTDGAKTNQSEEAVLNNNSIEQASYSQTTENSDVWENLQEFGEFRLQRRVSTIPTNIHEPSRAQSTLKEEFHFQQWVKTETEQSISDEQHAVFLAGTLTSQDIDKINKAADNPDSEDLRTVTFGKIYFIRSTSLGMPKILTTQDNKDFEAPSEISSQVCKMSSTNEDTSVVNSTITTTQLLQNPDGSTNQNILASSNNITMAHGGATIGKTEVRFCQSQKGEQSEKIFQHTSQFQTAHHTESGHGIVQTPTGDAAQPQELEKQMSGMVMVRKASFSHVTDATNPEAIHRLDQETNSETDTETDHKTIQVSESKTIQHSESTSNLLLKGKGIISQVVKQNEECVHDKKSNCDPDNHISKEREPQFLVKEETVLQSQEIKKEKTYQSEKTMLNTESSIQRSCSHIESSEMASEILSEKAAADTLTSRHQALELGKSEHLKAVSSMKATTIVATDSISHETDSMRLNVQHPELQSSNEVPASKTEKGTDPKTDKPTKSANNNQFQEGKSDDKASSKDAVVMTQISTAKDEETNQVREMKLNKITESSEIWETLQDFGEFRLERKVTKHYRDTCRMSHTGQKEESQLEQSETPIRRQDVSHTQHAVFLAGILGVNERDKIFKAVANPPEVLPGVTFKKIVFIRPTDLEMVQRMT